jgi:hypothetical protein
MTFIFDLGLGLGLKLSVELFLCFRTLVMVTTGTDID